MARVGICILSLLTLYGGRDVVDVVRGLLRERLRKFARGGGVVYGSTFYNHSA